MYQLLSEKIVTLNGARDSKDLAVIANEHEQVSEIPVAIPTERVIRA